MWQVMGQSKSDNIRQTQFEDLAYPLMDQLYRTALYLTQDSLDAEDLVQLTYMRAWKYFDQFEERTNFRAWIFRILRNNFINEYRRNKRKPQQDDFEKVTLQYADKDEKIAPDYVPKSEDFDYMFDDTISGALKKLPEHYRSVVLLSDVIDLPYKEIAEVLDCPIGTVMSRLHRGRSMLARSLKPYAQDNGYVGQTRHSWTEEEYLEAA